MLREVMQDVRFAFRLLNRRRGFAAMAMLTLALGIGLNVAIFSVLDGVLIQRLPFPHPERLVRVGESDSKNDPLQPFNAANYVDVQGQVGESFVAIAAYRGVPAATLTGAGEAVKAGMMAVRPEFFDVIGVRPVIGRPLVAADLEAGTRVVVVSHTFWRSKLGADPLAVNRAIELDGQAWTVVGVMPDGIEYPSDTELWKPLVFSQNDLARRNSWNLQVIGRLREGVTIARARASAQRAMAVVAAANPGPVARSADVVDLREDTVSFVRKDLIFIQGIAVLILLIACANLANLLLAAATARHHEFSVRGSLGGSRPRLIRQLLTESLVVALAGSTIGIGLALVIVPALVAAYPGALPGRERIGIGLPELTIAVAGAVMTSVIFGLAPALLASRSRLSSGLRTHARTGATPLTRWLRNALVTAEVIMTLSLLAGAVLLARSFVALTGQSVGFDSHHVLTAYFQIPAERFPVDAERSRVFETLIDRIGQEPAVDSVASTLPLPFDGSGMGLGLLWDPALAQPGTASAAARWVSPRYLDVLSIPLARGRFFTPEDRNGSPLVAVVTDAFARQYGKTRDVLGMRLRRSGDDPWITIVGVTGDIRADFFQKARAEMMFPIAQAGMTAGTIILRTHASLATLAPRVRQIAREIYPNLPMGRIDSLEQVIGDSVAQRRFNMALLGALSMLALLLSVIGIYGVMAYVTGQRRREMGIRLALGARPSQVRSLVVRQGILPVVAGIAGGLAGAWFLTTLLKTELFQVQPHDPWTFAVSSIAFLGVGLAACWVPARRGSRVNPVEVLRHE